jgi:hypothetical protein
MHIFLTSALAGGEWSDPRGQTPPRYPLDRRLGGPQSRSEGHGEEKILDPTGTRTPTPRSSSYTDYAILAPTNGTVLGNKHIMGCERSQHVIVSQWCIEVDTTDVDDMRDYEIAAGLQQDARPLHRDIT